MKFDDFRAIRPSVYSENELIRFLGNKFLSLFFKSRALRQLLAKYQSNWLDFGRHQETSKNCIIDRWKIKLLSPFHRDDIYHENSIKTSPPFTEIHEKIIKSKPLTKNKYASLAFDLKKISSRGEKCKQMGDIDLASKEMQITQVCWHYWLSNKINVLPL